MNTCENCAHRFIDFSNGQSVCRRYPPTVHITPQGQGLTMFPPVNGQMVCGEWEDEEIVFTLKDIRGDAKEIIE